MVRSGSVSSRSRASSPTITLPLESTLTTDGHNDDPYGPGIIFGAPVCASMYAIRLYVVPRSIPTTLPMIPLQSGSKYLNRILALTTLLQFLSARHPQDSGCSFDGSRLHSCVRATTPASRRLRQNQSSCPTAIPARTARHPRPSTSLEMFQQRRRVARAAAPCRLPRLARLVIHPAIRSVQKPLPAVPAEPAASSYPLFAHSKIPANIPRVSVARVACGMRRSIPTSAPAINSSRIRSPSQNCQDAASSSAYGTDLR